MILDWLWWHGFIYGFGFGMAFGVLLFAVAFEVVRRGRLDDD